MKRFAGCLFFTLMVVVACGDDNNPLSYDSLAGTYTLDEIRVSIGSATNSVRPPDATGTLVLTNTRSFTLSVNSVDLGMDNSFSSGTYGVNEGVITFSDEGTGTVDVVTAAVDGSRLTLTSAIDDLAVTLVFVKV